MKQKLFPEVFRGRKAFLFSFSRVIVLIFVQSFFMHAFGQVAPVSTPTGGFNIDGTLKVTSAAGDWTPGSVAAATGGHVLQNTGGTWGPVDASKTTFTRDGYGTNPDLIFNAGQFGQNPNIDWTWKSANSLNKCDIGTVLIHSTTSSTNKWLILGGDRLAQTGTSYIDFEFSQGLFTRLPNLRFSSLSATGGSLLSTGGRTVGDFCLSMEYTQGGALATIHYYRWEQAGAVYKFVEKAIPQPNGVISAFGRSNTVTTDVPFGAFGSTTYPPYAFAEAAVNIDAILSASCQSVTIRSVFVKTKSSDAYNADLKDFVDPQPVNFVFGNAGLDYGAPAFCKTGTITPTAPSQPNGSFTAPAGLSIDASTGVIDLNTSTIGTYQVTYTPSGGTCIAPATTTITINPIPGPPTVTVVNNCDGSSDLTASNYTGTLLWSNGATTASIHVTNAATYTVTQTSAAGCTSTAGSGTSAPRTTPGAPSVNVVNNCDGSSDLTASNYTGTLLWSNGATTASIHVTNAATYTVTQTSAAGCTSTAGSGTSAPRTTPGAPTVNVVNNCNGSADLTASNYTGTLLWSNGATTPSIHVTNAATYTVTQTSAAGCTSTAGSGTSAPRTAPGPPTVTVVNNCNGSSDLTASNYTGTLLWSNGATTASIHVTNAATYTVTQTSIAGCTSTAGSGTSAPRTTPGAPTVNVVNNCDGSSDLTASNYTGTLLWSNGATTASIHVTNAATYTVTQTSASGCTSTAGSGTSAPNNTPATPTLCVTQPSLCGPSTGSVTVVSPLDDATHDYEYRINGGTWGDATTFTGLAAGSLSGNATGVEVRLKGTQCTSQASKSCATVCTSAARAVTTTQGDIITNAQSTGVTSSLPAGEDASLKKVEIISISLAAATLVSASPNPFTDKIKFSIQSALSGRGTLDLYNMMGQKIKTVFEGYIDAGKTRLIEYNVPFSERSSLTWVFTVGERKVSGKLIGIK